VLIPNFSLARLARYPKPEARVAGLFRSHVKNKALVWLCLVFPRYQLTTDSPISPSICLFSDFGGRLPAEQPAQMQIATLG
jgi:hypothetical protein